MTPQQYQARNQQITDEISKLLADNTNQEAIAGKARVNAREWRNQKTEPCKGTAKNKQACEFDNLFKEERAKNHDQIAVAASDKIEGNNTLIEQLQAELDNNLILIREAQVTADQVAKELAGQGKTYEGVLAVANSEAKAIEASATITASAEAARIIANGEAEAANKKKIVMIVSIVGGVLVLGAIILLVKKFKKKK